MLSTNYLTPENNIFAPFQTFDYQNLLQLIHDPVIIFDPVTNLVLDVNDVACWTYKIEREDFIGFSINVLWIDRFRESEMFGEIFSKGWAKDFETIHLRSDGSRMNIIVNASLTERNGERVIISINQNVTKQRRAEEGIKIAISEWRDTVDSVSDMIVVEDGHDNLRRCNKATADFLGLSYEEIIGKSIISLFPARSQKGAFDTNAENYEHLRSGNWEGQFEGCDEWFEINNHPINADSRSETSWVHVIKNITKRKSAEEELMKFFTVVEQAASPIFITDLNGKIQYVNFMAEEFSGKSKNYFTGKTIFEVKPEISKKVLAEQIIPTLAESNIWQKITKTKRENEELFEEITASKVKDKDENIFNYVFICRDVTETRRLESIAEAVNMMDNVGYIFSGIRHELGNPINSVKMALTVLEKNLEKWDKEQIGVYINRSMSEISRVEYLLRTLKSFSLHENPEMDKVSLTHFMENFICFTKEDFEKRGIEIELSAKDENTGAWCDPRALHQVMLNLIANAADALKEKENPKITISLRRIKTRVQVSVEDNGSGMNEKQIGNLFKPFYTSKENGTGLGLVIVQKMLTRMNGTISIESKTDAGTQVKFTLETIK